MSAPEKGSSRPSFGHAGTGAKMPSLWIQTPWSHSVMDRRCMGMGTLCQREWPAASSCAEAGGKGMGRHGGGPWGRRPNEPPAGVNMGAKIKRNEGGTGRVKRGETENPAGLSGRSGSQGTPTAPQNRCGWEGCVWRAVGGAVCGSDWGGSRVPQHVGLMMLGMHNFLVKRALTPLPHGVAKGGFCHKG